ncbi:thioredoxin family protein [Legionella sp. W05-934-2]|jgi:thiol-disulfide isomerase/thioredoxin|uniref:thioredoxin family protein n=1 Tax=Legionella sp. W05-934-2 TaxID=1198649 RepID=UPI00346375F2
MSKTPSNMLQLGTEAPLFSLDNVVTNTTYTLKPSANRKGLVVMFICNHCPYVKHVNSELVRLANHYQPKGIECVAINSNDVEKYPQDSPDNMVLTAKEQQYPFPYLFDNTQEVAKAYKAACTPDFYLFDSNLSLVYRGQLDDSRPGNDIPVTGEFLRQACDQLLAGQPITVTQKPSLGCNIKWKS